MADGVYQSVNKVNQRILDYQTITLAANAVYTYNGFFFTVSVLSVNLAGVEQAAGTVVVALEEQTEANIFGGMYFESQNSDAYMQRAVFRNTTASTITVVVLFGSGKTEDRRLQLASTISLAANSSVLNGSGSTVSASQSTVGVAAAYLYNLDTTQKRVTIKSDSTNTGNIYIAATTGVTLANGHLIEPGESITLDNSSRLAAIATVAAQKVTVIRESI